MVDESDECDNNDEKGLETFDEKGLKTFDDVTTNIRER